MLKYLTSLLIVLLAMQCDEDALPELRPQEATFGSAFLLEQDGQVEISGEGAAPLTLELHSLNDSRCPEDVVCVWLGNAAVVVLASNADQQSEQLDFCIGDCRPAPVRNKHTVRLTLGKQAYEVTLLEVLPYPNTKATEGAKHVKLLVEPVS